MGIGDYADREFSAVDPKYYRNHKSGIECIDIIRYMPFPQGNAIKYLWRAGDKDDRTQDLNKALWYAKDALNNAAYVNVWHQEWSIGPYKEAYDRWDAAEKPGHRKESIKELINGNIPIAIEHILKMSQ